MGKKIRASDVMDPDATVRRFFRGQEVGHFQRIGPNSWDDYTFKYQQGEEIDVLPGIKVQRERYGVEIRMRRHGRVVRVRWSPRPEEQRQVDGLGTSALRRHFVDTYLAEFDEKPGMGATAVIADKLDD